MFYEEGILLLTSYTQSAIGKEGSAKPGISKTVIFFPFKTPSAFPD